MHAERYVTKINYGYSHLLDGIPGIASFLKSHGVLTVSKSTASGWLFGQKSSREIDVYLAHATTDANGVIVFGEELADAEIDQINAMLSEQATANDITQSSKENER